MPPRSVLRSSPSFGSKNASSTKLSSIDRHRREKSALVGNVVVAQIANLSHASGKPHVMMKTVAVASAVTSQPGAFSERCSLSCLSILCRWSVRPNVGVQPPRYGVGWDDLLEGWPLEVTLVCQHKRLCLSKSYWIVCLLPISYMDGLIAKSCFNYIFNYPPCL